MKVVTVHRGARDGYQVARGLHDAGMLEALVTDLYWPADHTLALQVERYAPARVRSALRLRHADGLPASSVVSCWGSGLYSHALNTFGSLPLLRESAAVRWCDARLGERAGRLATERGAALLSYSYYGHSAFSHYAGRQPRILFQLHPHPASVRAILQTERRLWPDSASSLDWEWELALPETDFTRLVEEPRMADHCLVASSYTKQTLVENGIAPGNVHVIPYGIDFDRFSAEKPARNKAKPLQLLFVGRLVQRKGIKYLLEALNFLPQGAVELTVVGRPVDDMAWLENSRVPIRLRESVNSTALLEAYREADVFVFPSLAEGFGHVLLEAMASGLAIISTTRTAAPDLIRNGKEGYIVPPGESAGLAQAIEYFLREPASVLSMGEAARSRAQLFNWPRFRQQLSGVVGAVLEGTPERIEAELGTLEVNHV
jgi:glycosyltransferase involved in cell wall biosynthesis